MADTGEIETVAPGRCGRVSSLNPPAPPFAVVMPVHNAGVHLDDAVASILAQTYCDFEFVVLDDGSTDGSRERLRGWAARDPRLRLIESDEKSGPVHSSNRVMAAARAPWIARMDADDVADPRRLELQARAVAGNARAALVGGLSDTINSSGARVRAPDWGRLSRRSPFPPFGHSTVLIRRSAFEHAGGYRSQAERWEDIDLYLRLAALGEVLVVPSVLTSVRLSEASSRAAAAPAELYRAMDSMYRAVSGGSPLRRSARLLPEAFMSAAAIRVWNGQRPRVLAPLLRTGDLSPDLATARMLLWAAWADCSPRSLRFALRALLAVRNSRAPRPLEPVRWQPCDPAVRSARSYRRSA